MKNDREQYLKKEQQILQGFFKEFFTWSAENIGQWIVAGIMMVLLGICMLMPFQEFQNDERTMLVVASYAGIIGGWSYLNPYLHFSEDKKRRRIYEKLQYLPVSLKALRMFRFRKLATFYLRLLPIFYVEQLFMSFLIYRGITWGNVLYPLVSGFLFPVVVLGLTVRWSK